MQDKITVKQHMQRKQLDKMHFKITLISTPLRWDNTVRNSGLT